MSDGDNECRALKPRSGQKARRRTPNVLFEGEGSMKVDRSRQPRRDVDQGVPVDAQGAEGLAAKPPPHRDGERNQGKGRGA